MMASLLRCCSGALALAVVTSGLLTGTAFASPPQAVPAQVQYDYEDSFFEEAGDAARCSAAIGPLDCNTVRRDANTASARADELYGGDVEADGSPKLNGREDAMRHCTWNALMALHIGADQAKEAADLHEELNPSPADARDMDFANNQYGRSAVEDDRVRNDEDAVNICRDATERRELVIINP